MSKEFSLFNLMRPEVLADPYPFYAKLRSKGPIYWDDYLKSWICTTYKDVSFILHDARFSANRIVSAEQLSVLKLDEVIPLYATLRRQLLFLDAPDHTRLRGLMNKVFSPRRVEAMRGYIQEFVDGVFDLAAARGCMDVVQELAYPLPATVIARMLGVPVADRDQLKKWSDDYAAMLGSFQYVPDNIEETLRSVQDMNHYFQRIIDVRRKELQDDLISSLIIAQEQQGLLADNELIMNCILLIAAGQETTTNLISNAVLTLIRHPGELDKLRADPSLIAGAIEEVLRFESPAQYTARRAGEDLDIAGKRIRQGQVVILLMGAANRDIEQFPEPDLFDIQRKECRHLAFGYAAHFCLGAALARLEGQIAIGTLFRRFPHLRLAGEAPPQWRENINLRGLTTLPVLLE